MKVKCVDAGGYKRLANDLVFTVKSEDEEHYYLSGHGVDETFGFFKWRFTDFPDDPQADQWDASRGPKMADPKGKAILKYQMPVLEQFELKLPRGAEIIRMEDQGGMFWLWAVVDTRVPDETRKFRAFKTGASIPDNFNGKYLGFCKIHVQMELGLYIFEDQA